MFSDVLYSAVTEKFSDFWNLLFIFVFVHLRKLMHSFHCSDSWRYSGRLWKENMLIDLLKGGVPLLFKGHSTFVNTLNKHIAFCFMTLAVFNCILTSGRLIIGANLQCFLIIILVIFLSH